jgi:hypothetical protein
VTRFEQFIKHRQYLLNVSHLTIRWYRHAFKWLPSENPTQEQLDAVVLQMRESGLSRQAGTRRHEPSTRIFTGRATLRANAGAAVTILE